MTESRTIAFPDACSKKLPLVIPERFHREPMACKDGFLLQTCGNGKVEHQSRLPKPSLKYTLILIFVIISGFCNAQSLQLTEDGYFDMPGLSVTLFHDIYPEGHQTGVTIIQHDSRVAANGDLRLEPAPGQWQPVPKVGQRKVDRQQNQVSIPCAYPNPDLNRKGFNPIIYPDLEFEYQIRVQAQGSSIIVAVDLENPLPEEWIGKVGFNLELFPGELFGKAFYMDGKAGSFPRQLNGPMMPQDDGSFEVEPLAKGQKFVIAPASDLRKMTIESFAGELELLDGRSHHNNGWFILRSAVPSGATKNAIQWRISPQLQANWRRLPVIQLSQVGYHPKQQKFAVIECDRRHQPLDLISLERVDATGTVQTVVQTKPAAWGEFLRYTYLKFDFSQIREEGLYRVRYGDQLSPLFEIGEDIYQRHVWQPVLEYFLPVQMCHMRINDRYRVWHGLCHMDDALMAEVDTIHFDGYRQGASTLTSFQPGQHVPGLNVGGWHDAGDYDLRVESQAATVRTLSLMREAFGVHYDETTVDQEARIVELHRPDGVLDILQQIEHGVLSIVGGYKSLGRLYRGIICPDLRQYVLLGDASVMTDNLIYQPKNAAVQTTGVPLLPMDDRRVFTEDNPGRELFVVACLAAANRALRNYNKPLADDCLAIASEIWDTHAENGDEKLAAAKLEAAAELFLTTEKGKYREAIIAGQSKIASQFETVGWVMSRVRQQVKDEGFQQLLANEALAFSEKLRTEIEKTPYGVWYRPYIWGSGWNIQRLGVKQYYLQQAWPELFPAEQLTDALNFILGCHPGSNTASFVSGVGRKSLLVAYGTNRADWSFIPGGSVSGTGLVRPDFPELKEWPFFWQQSEYVIGGGASNFMFMVLAAQELLKEKR